MCPAPRSRGLEAQVRTITLADAIRLSERVQPDVVRAAGAVTEQRGPSAGAPGDPSFPSVTASSSASDFYTEGAPRVDPVTGQITGGNSSNRSISTGLSASIDLFTGFRRGAEMRAAQAERERGGCFA